MKLLFPLLLMLVLFSSSTCKNQPNATKKMTTKPIDILHKTWYLESMTLAGKNIRLFPATLVVGEKKITGKGGCNNFFGTYKLDGDKITMSKIGATRMYCQEASKFETKYLRALEKVTSFSQGESRLTLTGAGVELVFSSLSQKTTNNDEKGEIHGVKWQLKSIVRRGVTERVTSSISLLVGKKKVSGNGGCNNYFGQLQMEGNRFMVSDIGATEMYCDETSKQEMAFLKLLKKVTTFRLADNQLVLSFSNGKLIFERK